MCRENTYYSQICSLVPTQIDTITFYMGDLLLGWEVISDNGLELQHTKKCQAPSNNPKQGVQ